MFVVICTNNVASSDGQCTREIAKGPGFDPQVPIFVNIIFFYIIRYTCIQGDHYTPSMSSQPDLLQAKSNTYHMEVYHRPSQACNMGSGKSTWAKEFWAQKMQLTPPLLLKAPGPSPFFLYFSFYFNSFVYFLTQN